MAKNKSKKKINNHLLLKGIFSRLNRYAAKHGFQATMAKVVKDTGTRHQVIYGSPDTAKVLKKCPCIIVANHPNESDIIAMIASLQPRKNTYLVVSSNFTGMLESLDRFLIPVYVNHRSLLDANLRFKLFQKVHLTKTYDQNIAHQKNIKSIKRASRLVSHGSSVVLFPAGGGGPFHHGWFNGIGYLIKNLKTQNQVYLINAHIQGTSPWDYLRIIPGLSSVLPKYQVSFASPRPLFPLTISDPKEITKTLESEYNTWSSGLPQSSFAKYPKTFYYLFRSLTFWFFTKFS